MFILYNICVEISLIREGIGYDDDDDSNCNGHPCSISRHDRHCKNREMAI